MKKVVSALFMVAFVCWWGTLYVTLIDDRRGDCNSTVLLRAELQDEGAVAGAAAGTAFGRVDMRGLDPGNVHQLAYARSTEQIVGDSADGFEEVLSEAAFDWFMEEMMVSALVVTNGTRPDLRRWIVDRYEELGVRRALPPQSTRRFDRLVLEYLRYYYGWSSLHAKHLTYLHGSHTSGLTLCKTLPMMPGVECRTPRRSNAVSCRSNDLGDQRSWASEQRKELRKKGVALPFVRPTKEMRRLPPQDECARRARVLKRNSMSLHMIENALPGGEERHLTDMPCREQHLSFTVLQEPVRRVFALAEQAFGSKDRAPVLAQQGYTCKQALDLLQHGAHNPLTRALLGMKAFREVGLETAAHVANAKRVLEQFDVVLTDAMLVEDSTEMLMRHALGIAYNKKSMKKLDEDALNVDGPVRTELQCCCTWEKDKAAIVREVVNLDTLLYEYGLELAKKDVLFWTEIVPDIVKRYDVSPDDLIQSNCLVTLPHPLQGMPGWKWNQRALPSACGLVCSEE